MAGRDDFSTTPATNTAINAINVGEGCPPDGINDAFRQLMAYLANQPEVTVASAATTDILGAASDKVAISGTTTITSFGTGTNRVRFLRFTGALTLTHNATSLILPGSTNIITTAGDTCIVESDASSNCRVFAYQKASGLAVNLLASGSLAAVASVEYTGIDSTFRAIEVEFSLLPATDGANLNATVQIGGVYQSSSYAYHRDTDAAGTAAPFGVTDTIGTAITLTPPVGSASTEGVMGSLSLKSPSNAARYKAIRWEAGVFGTSSGLTSVEGHGSCQASAGAITGVKLAFSSGNIASGTYAVYGVR